jgi:hypothetical protein
MSKHIALLAAASILAAACASNPAPAPGMTTTTGGAVALPGASAGAATVSNMAATTAWLAEEKLIPQDPVLALVSATGGDVDNPMGVVVTCNPANGGTTMKVGKQPANRVGQSATFRLRTGASAQDVEGKFQANTKSPEADFVFPIRQADLLAMSQLDLVSILDDQGAVQWAFVKDPASQVQAKYVASLRGMPQQATDFVAFCNPK